MCRELTQPAYGLTLVVYIRGQVGRLAHRLGSCILCKTILKRLTRLVQDFIPVPQDIESQVDRGGAARNTIDDTIVGVYKSGYLHPQEGGNVRHDGVDPVISEVRPIYLSLVWSINGGGRISVILASS